MHATSALRVPCSLRYLQNDDKAVWRPAHTAVGCRHGVSRQSEESLVMPAADLLDQGPAPGELTRLRIAVLRCWHRQATWYTCAQVWTQEQRTLH